MAIAIEAHGSDIDIGIDNRLTLILDVKGSRALAFIICSVIS